QARPQPARYPFGVQRARPQYRRWISFTEHRHLEDVEELAILGSALLRVRAVLVRHNTSDRRTRPRQSRTPATAARPQIEAVRTACYSAAMASAGRSPSLAAPARPTGLHQLWESGQRAAAVRRALADWDDVLRQADDLSWLEQAPRGCGLPAEAAAVQAERARRSGRNAKEWEAFLRSILQCGDPWWAR